MVVVILIILELELDIIRIRMKLRAYNNEVIVIPNFESVDYLYDKVEDSIQKIASNDTIYLKKIFGDQFYES